MTILGIAETTVTSLMRPLTDPSLDRDALADRFARATWTGIAEPGDRPAGRLVNVLGAETALALLLDRRAGSALADALRAGSAGDAEPDDREEFEAAVARWVPRLSRESALRALTQAARFGVRLMSPDDAEWPAGFADLGDHGPIAIWMRGRRESLTTVARSIALVGARAATGYGEHVTIDVAAGLVDRGFTIVSGAAYGIDGAAHRATLASRGTTIAFLAGGLDRFYPSGHEALLTRIMDSGAILTEVPCGTAPTKWRFLQRNRLIAAASAATVVIEAGWRSGSLNTAGHAAALGRPLGAVPGPVTSTASAGCHRLLREFDAVCVTNADEMAELVPLDPTAVGNIESPTDEERHHAGPEASGVRLRLLDALSNRSGRSVDAIAILSGLAPDRVRAELGLLELEGTVIERPSGWVRTTP